MKLEDLNRFLSGGLAGIIAKTAIAPLDRVKVLFQATVRHFSLINCVAEFKRIISHEGYLAFWKGNGAQLIRIFPYSAIVRARQQFSAYDYYKKHLFVTHTDSKPVILLVNFLPGSLAGATSVLFTYPFEVLRTRLALQVNKKEYSGILNAFSQIARQEGLQGIYSGILPTSFGILIYSGVSFMIYFSSKEIIGYRSKVAFFTFGALAGVVGQASAYPFDVVRKRLQAQGFIEKVSDFKSSHSLTKL
jgi:solute carrier family 25 protein 16